MFLVSHLLEHNRYLNFVGILVILSIAWLFSRKRSNINFKLVLSSLGLHFFIGFLMLKVKLGQKIVQGIAYGVSQLYLAADAGSSFVFGSLADPSGPWGFIFAIKVLPAIVFFGAFMALLFHFGIVQRVVAAISFLLRPILGTTGAETLCAISNSFLGQTEAPLLIKEYLKDMTESEFLLVMISGMATISGAILVVFAAMGVPITHLLAASMMGIPASILISKILLPETEVSKTNIAEVNKEKKTSNMFDAIFVGTSDGLQLAMNVAAMLISFLALLSLVNAGMGYVSIVLNDLLAWMGIAWQLPELSINAIFAFLFAPFGYLLGFTGHEALKAGELLGTKVAVNELVAYSNLVKAGLSERTTSIITYALCGFSNFSCIGIQLGGIGALVSNKRKWLAKFGLTAVLGGALANLLSAMVASLLL
ncbi:NupC/NupG family nucleoside CNT transporter [bacterium]|nr:NupC/NupG family nucleoside CNT transporter [bacterium]